MQSTYVTPLIKSVQNVFETMLHLHVQIGQPVPKHGGEPAFDVCGIIRMSGDVEGSIVLGFPAATAERIVALFIGQDLQHAPDDLPDAIGELVNMISGCAKARFDGRKVSITCPSVVIGRQNVVYNPRDVVCIHIPCESDCGDFAVELTIAQTADDTAVAGAGAAQA